MNSEIPAPPIERTQDFQQVPPLSLDAASLVQHRRQSFWQIGFPLIVAILLALLVGILAILASSTPNSYVNALHWANISLIALILVSLLVSFLFLVILAAVVYGLARLLQIAPAYTQLAQYYVQLVTTRIRELADKPVQPVMSIQSWWSGAQTFGEQLRSTKQSQSPAATISPEKK